MMESFATCTPPTRMEWPVSCHHRARCPKDHKKKEGRRSGLLREVQLLVTSYIKGYEPPRPLTQQFATPFLPYHITLVACSPRHFLIPAGLRCPRLSAHSSAGCLGRACFDRLVLSRWLSVPKGGLPQRRRVRVRRSLREL